MNKGIDQIFITTVNDPFVTVPRICQLKLDPKITEIPVRVFSDSKGEFASLRFVIEDFYCLSEHRGYRAAIVIDNKGEVLKTFDEPG